jgi:hypothetical protein
MFGCLSACEGKFSRGAGAEGGQKAHAEDIDLTFYL